MARQYGTNGEVIAAFANGDEYPKTNGTGSIFHEKRIDYDVIFSYGNHFPMGIRIKNKKIGPIGTVIVNGDRYSVTTAAHQSGLLSALSGQSKITTSFAALENATGTRRSLDSLMANLTLLDFEDEQSGHSGPAPEDATTVVYEDEIETVKIVWLPRAFNSAEQNLEYHESSWQDNTRPRGEGYYNYKAEQKRITRKTGRKVVSYWHRAGACLFRFKETRRSIRHYIWHPETTVRYEQQPVYDYKTEYSYLLCSMDEREYFVAVLPRPVKTVKAAFESLKPLKVRKAEQAGIDVKRQGEWFFLPFATGAEAKRIYKEMEFPFDLPREQWGNLHRATRGFTKRNRHFVSGRVSHPEHKTLVLSLSKEPAIFEVVKNTEKASFVINGGID